MRRLFILLIPLLFTFCGSVPKAPYRIAVDPSFFPIELMGKEANVFAFTNEILQEISKKESILLERVTVSWDDTLNGLDQGLFDAVLSPLPPYNFNLAKYDFSKTYLSTGYVLVTQEKTRASSLDDFHEHEVAVEMNSEAEKMLDIYPNLLIRFYDSPAHALDRLSHGSIDGVVMDVIPAVSFVEDLYEGQLKIVGKPLNDAGLKMITLKDTHQDLIEHFNRGLKALKRDGIYDDLIQKWNVGITR